MSAAAVLLLTLVLALLSMAGAGIYPWTLKTVALLLPAVALPILLQQHQDHRPRQWLSPLLLLFLYTLLMLAPLPGFLHNLSPIRAQANRTAAAAIEQVSQYATSAPDACGWFALTRSRSGTIRFLLLCIAGASAWVILRQASPRNRTSWLIALLVIGVITACAGILGKWVFPQGDTLYWYIPVPHGRPGPMGGFLNRNHFGGFLAILAPAALCLLHLAIERKRFLLAGLALSTTLFLAAGALLSFSRGAALALLAGLLATAITLICQLPPKHKLVIAALTLLLLGGGTLGILRVPELRARLADWNSPATHESASVRWFAWRDALAIAQAYPILGAGPNAFRTVYPQHRITSERAARDFAENEYVQWLAETGLAGLLLAVAITGILARKTWQTLYQTVKNPLNPLAPAAIGALAAAAMHATVDFPLRLPLYAITLAALAALLWPVQPAGQPPRTSVAHTLVIGIGLVMALALLPAHLRLDAPGILTSASISTATRALHAAPTYPLAWRRLSAVLWQRPEHEAREQALQWLTQAARYDPNNYVLWSTLGQRRQAIGDNCGANEAYRRVRELRDWVKVPHLPEDP